MRAGLSKTRALRLIRNKKLGQRIGIVATSAAALNIPCGMWRENSERLSCQWFVAVHASIPLVMTLRKSALLPPEASALNIASAILGQTVGAMMYKRICITPLDI